MPAIRPPAPLKLVLAPSEIALLVTRLDHEGIGLAVRLMDLQLRTRKPVPDDKTIYRSLGIDIRTINRHRTALLTVFALDARGWSHPAVARRIAGAEGGAKRGRPSGRRASAGAVPSAAPAQVPDPLPAALPASAASGSLSAAASAPMPNPIEAPPHSRARSPAGPPDSRAPRSQLRSSRPAVDDGASEPAPRGDRAERKPLAETVRDEGVALLMRSGRKEAHARACIGLLLKEHGADAVAMAIGAATHSKAPISEPFAWMRTFLKNHARKTANVSEIRKAATAEPSASADHTAPPPVMPASLGISEGLAERIRRDSARANQTFNDLGPIKNSATD